MTRKIQGYGWIPDLPDHRDLVFEAPPSVVGALPPSVDLRGGCPPVYDQGKLGSCTANAIAGAVQFDAIKEKSSQQSVPSRLLIYYDERVIEGTVGSDSGAMLRDGIKAMADQGACSEDDWPYDIDRFADKPPAQAYADAAKHRISSYQRVATDLSQMKGCLAAGYPFVLGFAVYDSFESQEVASSGHAPMPGPGENQLGGHAVLAVGYDDASQWFLVRNSWGTGWGMAGYFTMPYEYLTQGSLASDFWTIRTVQ
jgi:C1A family cysteine protease